MSKKSNVLRSLLASKPVQVKLPFGINENVRLMSITNEPRVRQGETIKKNTWLTFSKFNSEGNVISSSEFSYFNLKHDNDFTSSNLSQQISHMVNLISIVNPDGVKDYNPVSGYESREELEDALNSKKGVKDLMNEMYDQFEEIVKDHIGPESKLMRIKVISDRKTGKYLQLPEDNVFAESMVISADDSNLSISSAEKRNRDKAATVQPQTADPVGNSPATSKNNIIDL